MRLLISGSWVRAPRWAPNIAVSRVELLINRFDSDAIKGELIAQLYSKKPNETEANKVNTLVNLIKPSLRKTLRPVTLVDFADLLSRSLQAERDEGEEMQYKPKVSKPVSNDNRPAP
ncbi:hypothetical protein TSAR_016325 [Trichomalopsis sarcophagae]|uniref:Uncharacterized protein n=1 Tax=Trichomalopsis sarcophagae TaxID=543379 RepID=A0A232EIY6_9HYME|nr:hypothetical protein TSAR_016325 [Trichomalopsis sarcophagae]